MNLYRFLSADPLCASPPKGTGVIWAMVILMVVGVSLRQDQKMKTELVMAGHAQLSAVSNELHNYEKQEDGLYNSTQIARGQRFRCFRNLDVPIARNIPLPLQIKMAALPSSLIAEQQRSIPVFLRRLLI